MANDTPDRPRTLTIDAQVPPDAAAILVAAHLKSAMAYFPAVMPEDDAAQLIIDALKQLSPNETLEHAVTEAFAEAIQAQYEAL